MAKRSRVGFPDPKEAGGGSPSLDRVGRGFYMFLARDGQARCTGVWTGQQAKVLLADRSFYVAGVGRL